MNGFQSAAPFVAAAPAPSILDPSQKSRPSTVLSPRQWKYRKRRSGSSYRQLCVKGKRIWACALYCEFMNEKEPRTPEQLAHDFNVPLEPVREAIEYCQGDPPEIGEDRRKDDFWADATGRNSPPGNGDCFAKMRD
jgi:hypothetical protein